MCVYSFCVYTYMYKYENMYVYVYTYMSMYYTHTFTHIDKASTQCATKRAANIDHLRRKL